MGNEQEMGRKKTRGGVEAEGEGREMKRKMEKRSVA